MRIGGITEYTDYRRPTVGTETRFTLPANEDR
jgi:hypothetical protein